MNMTELQKLAAKLGEVRNELSTIIARLQIKQSELMQDALPGIRRCVNSAADKTALLINGVDENRALFDKPKSQVFEGIRFGLRKGSGGISWEDDDQVVALIQKHFAKDEAELLIKTTRKPIKSALNDLDVADLKKIGCTVEGTSEVVFVKPVDTAVDKIVNALLKSAIGDQKEAA
jgi:hypothetical protein